MKKQTFPPGWDEKRIQELLGEIDALKQLPHGWDSYSAAPPSRVAVKNAKALVIEAGKLGAEPERVEPSAMGGVGVTFSAGRREVVVEFYNNGTATHCSLTSLQGI